ncbi:hypothetical protein PTKIN_Ptkin14bG0081600 [Pterospermum kingtungense]
MAKNPSHEMKVVRRGGWSPKEDERLIAYISRYGIWNWNEIPKHAGKSCRLRWLNYLRPGIQRGNISKEEEEIIVKLHNILGNRWSAIAAKLPQRTDNEIKNYWNTRMKKRNKDFSSKTEYRNEAEAKQENIYESDSSSKKEESPHSTTYHLSPFRSSQAVPAETVHSIEDYVGSSETSNEAHTVVPREGSDIEAYSVSQLYDSYYVPSYDFWASPFF